MLHKYNDGAQRVLDAAITEARTLHHAYIGTDHILVALAKTQGTKAYSLLTEMGINSRKVRQALLDLSPQTEKRIMDNDIFTDKANQALEVAYQYAREKKHKSITPEDILYGILEEGNGAALRLLQNMRVSHSQLEKLFKEL